MYFELVQAYLATFVNDISLMNFSAYLTASLYICCNVSFSIPSGLIVPEFLSNFSSFQSSLFALSTSVVKLPLFVGTAKVEIFFNLSSFLFFIF